MTQTERLLSPQRRSFLPPPQTVAQLRRPHVLLLRIDVDVHVCRSAL